MSSIRHKAVKASLEQGYASEWNDDHHIDFTDELLQDWVFSSTNIPDEFTTSLSGTGAIDVYMVNNHNFLNIETVATGSSVASLILGDDDVTNKLDLPIFTTAVRLEDVDLAEYGFFVKAGAPFTANQKGAYFRCTGGNIYAVCGNGVSETAVLIGAYSEYAQYKIEFTSTSVRFYINNLATPEETITTNIPTDDLTLKISAKNQTAAERILRVDGIALMRLRKK